MRTLYNDYVVPLRTHTLSAWLETVFITVVAIGLGYSLSPQDPFLVAADFPWMLFAPLLVAVRYGLLAGLFSVSLILAGLLFSVEQQTHLPISYMVGLLLATFLAGEFHDLWLKKLILLQRANEYRQYRLDDFTRSYRLLQISHDDLELRIAGGNRSLRSTLQSLRRSLQAVEQSRQPDLANIAEQAMQIFSEHSAFTAAALYPVDAKQGIQLKALTVVGQMPQINIDDVLLKACLEAKRTVSIRDELLDKGENPSQLQVCVPLLDTEQNWVGILAIAQLPFFAMTEQTLNLLTLISGYIADALHANKAVMQLQDSHAQYFSQQLQRAVLNTHKYKLSAALCAFEMTNENSELQMLLEHSQRGLDLQLEVINNRGSHVLLVLLPLTRPTGVLSYLERINALVEQQFPDMNLARLAVTVRTFQLDQAQSAAVRQFVYQESGLNEQQLVV